MVGGIKEGIGNAPNCFLVEPSNKVQLWNTVILAALKFTSSDDINRHNLRLYAKEHYSLPPMIEGYINLYNRYLSDMSQS